MTGAAAVDEARPDDVAALAELEDTCLGGDAWSAGLLAAGVAGSVPTVSYLVARGPGGVLGYAVASSAGDVVELQRIAVAPPARRQGIASRLLAAVVDRATDAGAGRLLLEVREDNAGALAFYAAAGFVEAGRRRRYYRDGTTAVVLQRVLDPA